MKKLVLLAFAVCFFTMTACNNDGGSSKVTIPDTFVTYDNDNFSIMYPGEMEVTWSSGFLNTRMKDNSAKLDAAYSDIAPSIDELKKYSDNIIYMLKNDGYTVGDPKIKNGVFVIRCVKEGEVRQSFSVVEEGRKGVSGNVYYPEADEATWKPWAEAIIASVKIK